MKRCVIVGGANIKDYKRIQGQMKDDDFFVFCDSGLRHLEPLGVTPSLIVGDFDSHVRPDTKAETIVLPCEKDDTDTVFAVKEAMRRGFSDFLIIGAVGERLDHTLGNVSVLLMLDAGGKNGKIVDDYSEMEIISSNPVFIDDSFGYFSLITLSEKAEGVTIENAKYPLSDAVITYEYQYGVSNEVLPGKMAMVSVKKGKVLLIKVF